MRANALMKGNVDALLRARGQTRKDLAQWCRRGESWISKIMKEERREFPMKYFDRIADFFGIATYQLLQPGITALHERRKRPRRLVPDRRVSHVQAVIRGIDRQELIRLVLSESEDDQRALYASLLHGRLGGTERSNTPSDAPPAASGAASGRQSGPRRPRAHKARQAAS